MTLATGARALLAGALAGFTGGLFGIGGGVVLVPLLIAFFGLTPQQATGTSLATLAATAASGVIVYARHGEVAWLAAALVALAGAPMAALGARLSARASRRLVLRAFAVFVTLVALRLLLWQAPPAHEAAWGPATWGATVGLAVVAGFVSGFLGVGGGVLLVPGFVLLLGLPQHVAQGTSLATMLVTAPAGAWAASRQGNLRGRLVPWLFAGAAMGAPIASTIALDLPRDALTRLFAAFLAVNALLLWRRAASLGQSSR